MISMTWPEYLRGECTLKVRLTPRENELLSCLLMRHPEAVPVRDLVEAIYPDAETEPDTSEDQIRIVADNLRKKLGPRHIVKDWRGYGVNPCN